MRMSFFIDPPRRKDRDALEWSHNRMRFSDLVRLLPAVVLLATSSLAVVRAPTHFLWMAAIGVMEWGHALAIICIAAAVPLANNSWSGRVAVICCALAAMLALTPILRAGSVARELPKQLSAAFGGAAPHRPLALVYTDLFRGVSPPEVKVERLIYSKVQDTELPLDFYRPNSAKPAPLVVAIHGGSWQSGDNKDFIGMDQYLAGRGYAVADIIYRLAPQWKFPAALNDTRAAIAFLQQRANSLNIDPHRIVLLGRSAGGQIALAVAYSAKDPGIRGVVSFYAPTDLYWSWEHPGNPLVIDTKSVLSAYLGGNPSEVPSNYTAASPTRLVTSSSPPTLLIHGGRDELVSVYQSERLAQRLREAGVRHFNLALPWATHGFDYILRGPGGQISTYAIEYFLSCVT